MGWYVLQIVIVFGLMFANIYFQWTESGWVGWCLSWALAYSATKLLSWWLDLLVLLRGAIANRAEPHGEPTRLLAARWHRRYARQSPLAFRVRKNTRELVEVPSRLPPRNQITGKRRPLLGGKNSLRRIRE